MRKAIAITFLISLLFTATALSEDLSKSTIRQLQIMQNSISEEIFSRSYSEEGMPLEEKNYLIGKDIPAGEYSFVATEEMISYFDDGGTYIMIAIFETIDDFSAFRVDLDWNNMPSFKTFFMGASDVGFPIRYILKPNQVLSIEGEVEGRILLVKLKNQ